jgi:transcriptional antiterminator RfaH
MTLRDGMPSHPIVWHVAHTRAHQEARAAAELTKQGFEVFLPCYVKQVRHARRAAYVAAPLFPGYVFVGFGQEARWRAINGTIGVVRLIMSGDRPTTVARGVVEGLMALGDENGYVPLPRRNAPRPGETVRIIAGSLADTLGLFEEVRDKDRVAILLDLLGRRVRVLMDESLIEKAA